MRRRRIKTEKAMELVQELPKKIDGSSVRNTSNVMFMDTSKLSVPLEEL